MCRGRWRGGVRPQRGLYGRPRTHHGHAWLGNVVVIHLGGPFYKSNQRCKGILAFSHALPAQQDIQGPAQNLGITQPRYGRAKGR